MTLAVVAAGAGQAELLAELMDAGVDVTATCCHGYQNALLAAVHNGHVGCVRVLAPHFDVDQGGYDRFMIGSPLWEASHRGHAGVVAALREAGATAMEPPEEIESCGGWPDSLWKEKHPNYDRRKGEWRS